MGEEEKTMLTQEGYDKLKDELEYLKTSKRAEIAEKIKVARGFGDLSENAEYDAAKDEQAQMESRIAWIEAQLKNSEIIQVDEGDHKAGVRLGSTVRLMDIEMEEEMTFTIVGTVESNPRKGKISNESPLGKALLGSQEGDIVTLELPTGQVEYKVLEIVK